MTKIPPKLKAALLGLFALPSFKASGQQFAYLKQFASSGPSTSGNAVIQTHDGNVLVVGTQSSPTAVPGQFNADIFLVKLRPNGDTIWTRRHDTNLDREYVSDAVALPDGRLVIVGTATSQPGYTLRQGLIMVTDSQGQFVSRSRHIRNGANSEFHAVKAAGNGGLIIGGVVENGTNGSDALLLKLDTSGDLEWSNVYGGSEFDDCWDVELAPDGGYLFTGGSYSHRSGTTHDDAWVVKVDANGQQQWLHHYGLADQVDWAWKMAPVQEQGVTTGYVFTGIRGAQGPQPGCSDIHFVKIDLAGNQVWDKSIPCPGGASRLEGMDVAQLRDGGFVIAAFRTANNGVRQLYSVRTDAGGDLSWSDLRGETTANRQHIARSLLLADDGSCYVTGSAETVGQPIRFMFLLKYSAMQPGLTVPQPPLVVPGLRLSPNPARCGYVDLHAEAGTDLRLVELFSPTGQLLRSRPADGPHRSRCDLKELPAGLYTLRIVTSAGIAFHRIIVY